MGLVADITLSPKTLSLQPALLYSNKGFGVDYEKMLDESFDDLGLDMDDFEGYARLSYGYIEIPINLVYKSEGLQVSAGPYVAVGVGGTFKHDFTFEVDGEDYDSNFFFEKDSYALKPVFGKVNDDDFKNFVLDEDTYDLFRALDYGLNFGIGYQVNNLLFNIGYSIGLNNLTPNFDADSYGVDEEFTEGVVQKNRLFTFSTSYFFN